MKSLKIGIQTSSLRQPLRRAIETAARLGADGVEIDARSELVPSQLTQTGIRQFRKLLDDYRLQVSAVAFPTRHGYDSAEELDRRVAATQAAMKLAYDLRCGVVVNRVGRVPTDNSPASSELVTALTALAAYGERVGARLAVIPGDESPAELAALLGTFPDETIGVDFHLAALVRGGHTPVDALADLGRYVLHVHACDAVGKAADGRAVEVDLGRGLADPPAVLARLSAEFDYRGWFTIERRNAADPVAAIGDAVAYLRGV